MTTEITALPYQVRRHHST